MEVIGIAEAAEILQRDRTMVHRYIREHRLPTVGKLPGDTGAYLLDRSVVTKFAAELKAKAAS